MTPFDPTSYNTAPSPENTQPDASTNVPESTLEQNTKIEPAAPARPIYPLDPETLPPGTVLVGDETVPPVWRIRSADEPDVTRYVYGPEAAEFEEPPPGNAEPPEPEEQVGRELTARQLAFCERYVECPVATRAAIRSGYSEQTAAQQASRLLKHPRIMQRILELRRKRRLEQAYRRETMMDKLEAVFTEALERREFYAAIQALTMQARLACIEEAMPSIRYLRARPNAGEQLIWDVVNRLEQKLCEITVGDFAGAAAAVPASSAGKSK